MNKKKPTVALFSPFSFLPPGGGGDSVRVTKSCEATNLTAFFSSVTVVELF